MKILTTDSKLWWLAVADEIRPQRGMSVVDSVRRFAETFQFASQPATFPGPNDGYRFQEGSVLIGESRVAIKEITIFNDGVSVEVYSNTDDLMATLDRVLEVLRWFGFRNPTTSPTLLYNSLISVQMDGSMNHLVTCYDPLARLMSEVFGVSGPCDARAIEFSMDPKLGPPLNPTVFRLERRSNVEYSENRYFSVANTTTANHIRLLREVESRAVPKES